MLPDVNPIAKDAGEGNEQNASHLELPGPLHGDSRHHPQALFRCAKTNQALNEKASPHQCQNERYPRPYIMKPNDDGPKWQIQKPIHEGASFPLAA
jgi:hypothetical protein